MPLYCMEPQPVTPLGRQVLVQRLPERPKSTILFTAGIGPDALTTRCTVLQTGPRCRYVKPGDTVLARTSLGRELGDHLLLPEEACLATCSPD